MTLSLTQKILIVIVQIGINALWQIEKVTSFYFFEMIEYLRNLFLVTIAVVFVSFIFGSFVNGYLYTVGEGILYSISATSETSYNKEKFKQVLGARSVKNVTPKVFDKKSFPELSARSVLVFDKGNSVVLYEFNSNEKLASASTTKLMTALVALDIYNLDEQLTVFSQCSEIDSAKAYLPEGTEYKVEDLINIMLISSAGDAACTLAYGKDNYDEFIYLMNQKAYDLGMKGTYFTNPVGLDAIDGAHFSDALGLLKLAQATTKKDKLVEIVKKKEFTINSLDKSYSTRVFTTNQLLYDIPQTVGIKTGTTEEAGEVLIYEYNDDIRDLLIIIMGSDDRFTETKKVLDWTLDSFYWD